MFAGLALRHRRKKALRGAKQFLDKKVGELMTPYVVTTRRDATTIQAATRMIAQDISCLVVVDENDPHVVKGIVTERDFIKKVPASSSALKKTVGDIMSDDIVAISPNDSLHKAFAVMHKHGFRKLIVKDNDQLVGIFTQTDVARHGLKSLSVLASKKPIVNEWMTKAIASVRPNATFSAAKKLMIKKDVGALLVKGAAYEGIFTEYDVVAQFYDQGGMLQIKSPKEIMHEHIRCISADKDILFANRVMQEKKVRRLLVVEKNKAVGILTQTDVARALITAAEEMLDEKFLEKQDAFFTRSKEPISVTYVSENYKLYA